MIRVVIYLAVVGVFALGAAWIADRPGDVVITWQGMRIETSVSILLLGVVVVAIVAIALWSLLRFLIRSPGLFAMMLRSRRGARGYLAISRGLIAIGSGDARGARKFADEARRIAPGEPLTLLLSAQSAQLAGDRGGAERSFRAMAGRDDTKLLGLHGLFMEAQRRNDQTAARLYAEEAARASPGAAWASHAVLDFRCAAQDWSGALDMLERNQAGGLMERAAYRRQRAVLLTAQALAVEAGDRDQARASVLEAVKLAPDLAPAAALAGRMLGEANELRRAARIVEAAWRAGPNPDLAETYAHLRVGDSARDRLKRVQTLAQKTPGHVEGALAVARAALDAQEFSVARTALAPLVSAPTQRAAILMAEIDRAELGDEGRAREWMARAVHAARDPAWTADGVVSAHWMPVSPITGRLDAFVWKIPLEELRAPGRVIEERAGGGVAALVSEAKQRAERPAADVPAEIASADIVDASPSETAATAGATEGVLAGPAEPMHATEPAAQASPEPPSEAPPARAPSARSRSRREPGSTEKLIPLIRAPDDPGTDPDPELALPSSRTDPMSDGWRRLMGLFK